MDARKELSLINKHVRQHNRESGEQVYWFEFVPLADSASAGSLYDDVYDEGAPGTGGLAYSGAILLPTIYVEEVEDLYTMQEEGRQPTQNIRVTFLYLDAERSGMSNPQEYKAHLNDMFFYENRYYKVYDYHVRGRLPSEVVIGAVGYEIYVDQEMPFDVPGPPNLQRTDLPWPAAFPS